ncbi:MAG: DUF4105 domain-containing protein [Anaerohalosphaeraceae bacterium]
MKCIFVYLLRGIVCLIMGIMAMWAVTAVTYSNLPGYGLRIACIVLFLAVAAGLLWKVRPFYKAALSFGTVWGVILIGWLCIPPSNNRNWQRDVAVLSSAQIENDIITVHNIRNCDYRTETDYTVSYYDKTFDLQKLKGADLSIIYWGSPLIAHTIMSFCFEDDQYLSVSIETRKEMGEGYSAIKGFFKQYELIYILGDERDLIRLRTNFRGESVYLYRLSAKPELVREVLLDYLRSVNSLNERPEWYNALTQNCTTSIRGHTAPYAHGKFSWKMIVNGYLDTLLYERKAIDTSLPFDQIKAISNINDKAIKAGDSPDFSTLIREGLPLRNSVQSR